MIAIALLIAGQAVSGGETYGPFVIESTSFRAGFPYELEHKITTLTWRAKSGLATFELRDTGEQITADYRLVRDVRMCAVTPAAEPLVRTPPRKFGEALLRGCRRSLTSGQARILRADIALARRHFANAYDAFIRRTIDQHGPSLRRCRETRMGHHGPICIAYWGEDRKAPAQGEDNRP